MISIDKSSTLSKVSKYLNDIVQVVNIKEPLVEKSIVEIPVLYGDAFGPDLERVATHCGITLNEVVKRYSEGSYLVYFIGFSIGFPYFGGMDHTLSTPRLENPRKFVPKGSIAIAGTQTGVYPLSSPGGWNLIGKTPLSIFNVDKPNESMLKMGDSVRFKPVDLNAFKKLSL